MNIEIEQQEDGTWRADWIELSGSPYVGVGNDIYEAFGSLMFTLAYDTTYHAGGRKISLNSGPLNIKLIRENLYKKTIPSIHLRILLLPL